LGERVLVAGVYAVIMNADGQRPSEGVERSELSRSQAEIYAAGPDRVIARMWAMIVAMIPFGYEDETGFHSTSESPVR
jgi:hypothetical protein